MMRRIAGLAITFCAGVAPHALNAANPPGAPSVILIQNATVLTVSHGTIEHGSILIKDGKIAEVGQSIKAPRTRRSLMPPDNSLCRASSIATRTSR